MLAGVGLALFGITAIVLMKTLPGPITERDYFIIGCLSTLVSLFALFLVLITTWIKSPNLFFKKRKREDESGPSRPTSGRPLGLS
jgi:Na+/melibiose symporter-like transporter